MKVTQFPQSPFEVDTIFEKQYILCKKKKSLQYAIGSCDLKKSFYLMMRAWRKFDSLRPNCYCFRTRLVTLLICNSSQYVSYVCSISWVTVVGRRPWLVSLCLVLQIILVAEHILQSSNQDVKAYRIQFLWSSYMSQKVSRTFILLHVDQWQLAEFQQLHSPKALASKQFCVCYQVHNGTVLWK